MSQSGITDQARAVDWDAWYVDHLNIMVSVPGISSAQRFLTDTPGYSPSLAMYSVAGPETFEDPYYLSVRGMGEWLPLIDRRYYQRNLFAGLDAAPVVPATAFLIVADRAEPDSSLSDIGFHWLTCVGVDRSTPVRGIAVVEPAVAERLKARPVAIYRPATDAMMPVR